MVSLFSYSAFGSLLFPCMLLSSVEAISCNYSSSTDNVDPYVPYNITNQNDADLLQECPTVFGDINFNITSNVTDITLNGVQNITGGLSFWRGSRLNSFIAPDLVEIGALLHLSGSAPVNSTFSFLTTVGGIGIWDDGSMESLNFPAGLTSWKTTPGLLEIEGTGLEKLEGIHFSSISNFYVYNNERLHSLQIDAETIGSDQFQAGLGISGNGAGNFDIQFPNLTYLYGKVNIWNFTKLEMPKLQACNATLTIRSANSSSLDFPSLQNMPHVWADGVETGVDSTLTIEESQLDSVDLPALRNVSGGLVFSNNKGALYKNLAFPNLKYAGWMKFEEDVDSYPGLNCTSLEEYMCNGTLPSEFTCLNTTLWDASECTSSGSFKSMNYNVLLSSLLVSLVGAALVVG